MIVMGIRFKGQRVPDRELKEIWNRHYFHTIFPDVEAWILAPQEFLTAVGEVRKRPGHVDTTVAEYGHLMPDNKIWAYLAYSSQGHPHVILVRNDSPRPLEEDLEHEFEHLHKLLRKG